MTGAHDVRLGDPHRIAPRPVPGPGPGLRRGVGAVDRAGKQGDGPPSPPPAGPGRSCHGSRKTNLFAGPQAASRHGRPEVPELTIAYAAPEPRWRHRAPTRFDSAARRRRRLSQREGCRLYRRRWALKVTVCGRQSSLAAYVTGPGPSGVGKPAPQVLEGVLRSRRILFG